MWKKGGVSLGYWVWLGWVIDGGKKGAKIEVSGLLVACCRNLHMNQVR